jgi:predicted DNA-binding protein with PD1-like motif
MQYFVSKTTPRTILIMFDRDDLLLEGLQEVVKKEQIDTAAITGGIGSLQRVHLHTITTTAVQVGEKIGTSPAISGECWGLLWWHAHAHISVYDWDSKTAEMGI